MFLDVDVLERPMLGYFACVWIMCGKMDDGSVSCLCPFVPYAAEGQGRGWAGKVCVDCMLARSQNNRGEYEGWTECWVLRLRRDLAGLMDATLFGVIEGFEPCLWSSSVPGTFFVVFRRLRHTRVRLPTSHKVRKRRTHFSTYLPHISRLSSYLFVGGRCAACDDPTCKE